MVVGGGAHHRLAVVVARFGKQVVEELLAVSHGEVAEAALTLGILGEVLEGWFPVRLVRGLVHAHPEVVKETLLALGAVEEAELLVDDGLGAPALDKLRLLEDAAVVFLLELLRRVGVDVEAQILTAGQLARLGVTDGRVEIEVERCLPILDGSLPHSDLGA